MQEKTETDFDALILNHIVHTEKYTRIALPHIKPEYFSGKYRVVYELILSFITKYNKLPNSTALHIDFEESDAVSRPDRNEVSECIRALSSRADADIDWLIDHTEKWCKDRAIHLALMEAINIIDGKSKEHSNGAIPDILNRALSVTFDTSVGHDYIDDASSRHDFYTKTEDKFEFDLHMMNEITAGGVSRKTLNIILAGTGVGKSLAMCHLAAAALSQNRNVLYITMEMAEERIAERIDANLLNVNIAELKDLTKESFIRKVDNLRKKSQGKLIVKEYPTASAHVGHFRALLHELKLKRNFTPDVIFVDYLNICASSRMKGLSGSINTYSLIKSIAEEIRGLAVEFNVPIWSATQVTRGGYNSSDVEITDTSECIATSEQVTCRDGTIKQIGDIQIGDQITSNDEYKTVMFRHHNKVKDCIKITTANGKSIVVSKDHIFPVKDNDGNVKRVSYNSGLRVGNFLHTK